MKHTIRNLLTLLVLLSTGSTGAWADTKQITYLYYHPGGYFMESSDWAEPLTSSSDNLSDWYYVEGTVTISRTLKLSGNTTIILCDGPTLTINTDGEGISGTNVDLTIYAQSSGDFAVLEQVLAEDNLCVTVKEGNTALLEALNKVIAEFMSSGTSDQYKENWGL